KLEGKIGLTTIYRYIERLEKEGNITKFIGKDNATYYEYLEECDACNTTPGSESCELDCILQKTNTEIIYFDDEELDRFKGRPADSYTDEEVEAFSEVMYTCREEEVPAWNRSLELRGIQFPDQLKDELYMLIKEQTHK
ncbi:MAG: hypothetical protein II670_05210, partial [Alphaproteobacteria bacterium]|nr:hypothetical protein [Alphaproteobacteria bacterium]